MESMTPSPLESTPAPLVVPLVGCSVIGLPPLVVLVEVAALELVLLLLLVSLAAEAAGSWLCSFAGGAGWGFRLHAWNRPPSSNTLTT